MDILTHNEATVGATEMLAESIISDLEVIVKAKRMQLGTAFTPEDGVVSALLRTASSLSQAAHVFTVTESLTNRDALRDFFEAVEIFDSLRVPFNALREAHANDTPMPS